MKKSILIAILTYLSMPVSFSQTVAYWPDNTGTPTTAKTFTLSALGIGTSTPRGWQEIVYCPPLNTPQNGLVVTKFGCNSTGMLPNFSLSDNIGTFWPMDSTIEVTDSFIVPFNFTIKIIQQHWFLL